MMVEIIEHTKLVSWGWVVVPQVGWVKVYNPKAVPLCELGPHVNTQYIWQYKTEYRTEDDNEYQEKEPRGQERGQNK